ncbi:MULTISPECIES: BolA family protein [Halolamina]|uniref:Transcriptional regulator BolA n=1 Tax=Halolamina pelagica TaxID=699431 RepID=A0A1I5QSQ9_9EURY|nr:MULTISPECIES: BolA family transcriptional regulator [Halolamina]NHX35524.1 BolA family transcriptional regulator [Halolamina sp. R1-12]SFP49295.1 Stress-induced morphogen (activity unknown) [Halolamina pelagica]
METDELEAIIEAEIPDAEATVDLPRAHHDRNHQDAHFAAVVVSPAFEGETLVAQHQMVYDAVGEEMTDSVHALEIETYTPEEYAERNTDEE